MKLFIDMTKHILSNIHVYIHVPEHTHFFINMNITFIVILMQVHYVFDPGDVGEDLQVKKLAFDLRNIEMVMAGVLTPEKLR